MKCLVIYFLILSSFHIGCTPSSKNNCNPTSVLIFIHKAPSCFTGKSRTLLTSETEISLICQELQSLSAALDDVYVNINYGYLEVLSKNKILYSIIISDYNGIIIRYNKKHYQNEFLIAEAMKLLEIKLKTDLPKRCGSLSQIY